jgi:ribonuclease P protein component
MLPRRWRLKSPLVFAAAYRRGRKLRADGFMCWRLPQAAKTPTQIGIVVSKKVSLLAAKRNLYRRRLWAAVRENKNIFSTQGEAIVIVAMATIAKQTYASLNHQIKSIFKVS